MKPKPTSEVKPAQPLPPAPSLAAISNREQLLHRIGFLEGVIEGITLYAIWRNGDQLVGCMERPLREVLAPYREEIARLTPMAANAAG